MRAKERLPRKHYSPEFKMELVRLALEEEGSIAALARKHDVNDNRKRLVRTVLIFTESSDQLSRATDRVP
uniref:transposase n=1 Tax=Escherichia coli TaxID=562 RepID=UPI0012FF8F02